MSNTDNPRAILKLDAASEQLRHIRRLLVTARELQWERPAARVDPEDPGIRSRGGHLDPTGDIATDSARLCLRRQVKLTEADLIALEEEVFRIYGALAKPLRAYLEETGRL